MYKSIHDIIRTQILNWSESGRNCKMEWWLGFNLAKKPRGFVQSGWQPSARSPVEVVWRFLTWTGAFCWVPTRTKAGKPSAVANTNCTRGSNSWASAFGALQCTGQWQKRTACKYSCWFRYLLDCILCRLEYWIQVYSGESVYRIVLFDVDIIYYQFRIVWLQVLQNHLGDKCCCPCSSKIYTTSRPDFTVFWRQLDTL
jgi:hypothetical protein